MPDTTNKLRRLVKSKHAYIEQHLASVVSVIRHSMQNAAFFEAAAERLKLGCLEMVMVDFISLMIMVAKHSCLPFPIAVCMALQNCELIELHHMTLTGCRDVIEKIF